MRRLLLLFTGFGLNQAQTFPPGYQQCYMSRAPTYFAALNRADACVYYAGTNKNECYTSNSNVSDPDFCTALQQTIYSLEKRCKKFTSVASQFCSLIDMEINPNFVPADLISHFGVPNRPNAGFDSSYLFGTGLLTYTPELYNESCRDIVRNTASQAEEEFQMYSGAVNQMCKNRGSSDDDNTLAIGLGVGLGVGIPFIGGLIYFIVKRSKKAETTESIEPFLN